MIREHSIPIKRGQKPSGVDSIRFFLVSLSNTLSVPLFVRVNMQLRRISFVLLTLLVTVLIVPLVTRNSQQSTGSKIEIEKDFINGWAFQKDIYLDDTAIQTLDADALIFRSYQNREGLRITVTVVYHENARWGAHDPLVCYKSQGWKIVDKGKVIELGAASDPLRVNRFLATKEGFPTVVYYYWFTTGGVLTPSRSIQMLSGFLEGLKDGYSESGFVEFSMGYRLQRMDEDIQELDDFVLQFTKRIRNELSQSNLKRTSSVPPLSWATPVEKG